MTLLEINFAAFSLPHNHVTPFIFRDMIKQYYGNYRFKFVTFLKIIDSFFKINFD